MEAMTDFIKIGDSGPGLRQETAIVPILQVAPRRLWRLGNQAVQIPAHRIP
jgi:hypothetical protein